MSEKKLQNLAKEYPQYSDIFKAVVDWFQKHPNQRAITMEYFYSSHYTFSIEDINVSFMIMQDHLILKTIYRLLDEGVKIEKDFASKNDIPREVSTIWGDKKDIEDVAIVPFYTLHQECVI